MEKIDIVLQGPYNNDFVNEIALHYLSLAFVNNIIISHHTSDTKERLLHNNIKFIATDKVKPIGSGNENLQIVSSLAGIKATSTKFIVKMRNDQKYTLDSIKIMYDFYNQNSERKLSFTNDTAKPHNRICVAGNFSHLPFHPRDHVFWGNKNDLIDLFSLPLDDYDIYQRLDNRDDDIVDVINKKGADWILTDPVLSPSQVVMKNNLSWIFYEQPPAENYSMPLIRTEARIGLNYIAKFSSKVNMFLSNPKEYVHDGAPNYYEALNISTELTPKIFKSFPRKGIDLSCPKNDWSNYPYDQQYEQYGERWDEDNV
jgi:phage terminase large subunit-like protein